MSDSETPDTTLSAPSLQEEADAASTETEGGPGLARAWRTGSSRTHAWTAVALLCAVAGTLASVLGARALAHSDSTPARGAVRGTSAAIASSLKQSLQHEEDLAVATSTFFASRPTASDGEFATWVNWAQVLHRYPELQRLGLVTLVRAPELAAFTARTTGQPAKPAKSGSKSSGASLRIVPGGTGSFHCLSAVELSRSGQPHSPVSLDYCALNPGLMATRDSAHSLVTATSLGHTPAVAILTPVYRGEAPPSGFTARRAAFVGWLREVLLPGTVIARTLHAYPGYAVRVRFKSGPTQAVFAAGVPQAGAQSETVPVQGGWTLRAFAPPAPATGVFEDTGALVLLIAGTLLSVLLGVLVFLLGGGRLPARSGKVTELTHVDLYDSLTGLPNRALMLDRADRMIARATRQSGLLVGALFIDIDWFKDVNDKLGQAAGDQLLAIVAERLEGVVRVHDTVGRLGGDEFVVLVESAARGARLDALARRVIEALNKPVELDGFGLSLSLTASIGVAFGRYATPEDLLRDAQLALTAAKAAGRNRYTLFNANMRSVIEGRGVMGVELNAALQDKQFFLLYEPIYDLGSRRVVELEAHIRWRHPAQGVLAPEDFIPLAEDSGLIVPIGRWAIEEACGRAAAWNVGGHPVGVSVKVSATQLNRDGFVTDVQRALQQSGIDASLLTLEIAETTVMRDVDVAAERLGELRALGVRIAVDEFGSGYAHHSDLKRLPLDFLKVDRNTLAATDDEEYRSWLLQAILVVGRDLSLPVIATGVETYEQMSTLHKMGCQMAQGELLGKPAPAENVEALFDADFPVEPETFAGPAVN